MSDALPSKEQLSERFEFWITTNGYNAARELAAFPKGGRVRIYVNPTVELAWRAVEAMHGSETETDCDARHWPPGTPVSVSYDDGDAPELGVLVENREVRVRFDNGDSAMEVVFDYERVTRRAQKAEAPTRCQCGKQGWWSDYHRVIDSNLDSHYIDRPCDSQKKTEGRQP